MTHKITTSLTHPPNEENEKSKTERKVATTQRKGGMCKWMNDFRKFVQPRRS